MELAVIITLLPAFILGCGGGGGVSSSGRSTDNKIVNNITQRSVKLHNYNNWAFPNDSPDKLDKMLRTLAQRDNICLTECQEHSNAFSGWMQISVQSIKSLNPNAKVYRLYCMMAKPNWDTDWKNPSDTRRMQFPITKSVIDANDWWLRDSEGNIIRENDSTYLIDVGKPGFKETFLKACLDRNEGKGFDGFVFDYVPMDFSFQYYKKYSRPKGYPTDHDYEEKAVKPFITYVTNGLHAAGYRIIGNCIGQFGDTTPIKDFIRSKMDGVIYEIGAISEDGYISSYWFGKRIEAVANDPLEVWVGEGMLRKNTPNFQSKSILSLAYYYISMPVSQVNRSYHCAYDWTPHWQSIWDFYIGTPAEPYVKLPNKYFWSRVFTDGIVLLNYEEHETIEFTLNKTYKDQSGKKYSGKISIPAHSALILAID